MSYEIRDINLAPSGEHKIDWVRKNCPLLRSLEEDFSKELKEFAKFEDYLQRLMMTARTEAVSTMPDSETILAKMQQGSLPPSALKEAYAAFILKQTPL